MIARILVALASLALAFAAGAFVHYRWVLAEVTQRALDQSEATRKVEHDNAVSTIIKMDRYSVTAAQNQPRVLAARTDLVGVQHSIDAIAAAAPASACGPDPRLAGVLELLRESASLVEEGPRHLEELRAKRDALSR
ncbi:hypothetical protein [Roseateles cavernae]|uniref:hypothetical protein n=1 Tax=Roseateles cavernae TaxID=3153578 RepID=UPI0032E44C32